MDSDGQLRRALCQGERRFRIESMVEGYPFLAARVQLIEEPGELSTQAQALGLQLRERAAEILSLLPGAPAELAHTLQAVRSPSHLADVVASLLDVESSDKQMLLETVNPEERLQKVLQMLTHRIEVLRLLQEIGERTKEQSATFRDNYLGVPFDLSCVVFVATANVMDQVPAPMRDRMEVIELPGYTQEEKLQIAQRPARFGGTVRRHRCACACTSRRDPEGRA